MPKMNGTGPDGHGPKTGRGLGKCKGTSDRDPKYKLGTGLGKRRHAGENYQSTRSRLK